MQYPWRISYKACYANICLLQTHLSSLHWHRTVSHASEMAQHLHDAD